MIHYVKFNLDGSGATYNYSKEGNVFEFKHNKELEHKLTYEKLY